MRAPWPNISPPWGKGCPAFCLFIACWEWRRWPWVWEKRPYRRKRRKSSKNCSKEVLNMAEQKVTTALIREKKVKGEKITVLTAYDFATAILLDESMDIILVGDSLGNVVLGYESTLPVTMEDML